MCDHRKVHLLLTESRSKPRNSQPTTNHNKTNKPNSNNQTKQTNKKQNTNTTKH